MTQRLQPVALTASAVADGTHFQEPKYLIGYRAADDALPAAAIIDVLPWARHLGAPTGGEALQRWLHAPLRRAGARVFLKDVPACLPVAGLRNAPLTLATAAPTCVAMAPFAAAVGAVAALDTRNGAAAALHGARLLRRLDAVPVTTATATLLTAVFHCAQGTQPVAMLSTVPHNSAGDLLVVAGEQGPAAAYALLEKGYRHLLARTDEPPPELDPEGSASDAVQAIGHAMQSITGATPQTLTWDRRNAPVSETEVALHKATLRALLQAPNQALVLVLAPTEAQACAIHSAHPTAAIEGQGQGLRLGPAETAQAVLTGMPLVLVKVDSEDKVLVVDPMRLAPSDWYATPTLQELAETVPEPPASWLTRCLARWSAAPSHPPCPPAYGPQAAELLAANPANGAFTLSLDHLAQLSHTLVACSPVEGTCAIDLAQLNAALALLQTQTFQQPEATRKVLAKCHWIPAADGCFILRHHDTNLDVLRRHPDTGQFIRVRNTQEVGTPYAAMDFIKVDVQALLG